MNGYLWRLARADATTLKDLIAAVLPDTCWSFGGALLWDVRTDVADKRTNLRPIAEVASRAVDISGDFGHAFAEQAEVRWKRREDGDYDVLVLAESQPAAVAQLGLTHIATYPTVVTMSGETALFLDTPPALRAQGRRYRLDYNEYRVANGAAQFARYTTYSEKPDPAQGG